MNTSYSSLLKPALQPKACGHGLLLPGSQNHGLQAAFTSVKERLDLAVPLVRPMSACYADGLICSLGGKSCSRLASKAQQLRLPGSNTMPVSSLHTTVQNQTPGHSIQLVLPLLIGHCLYRDGQINAEFQDVCITGMNTRYSSLLKPALQPKACAHGLLLPGSQNSSLQAAFT
jgi:hypothetical protein